MKHSWKYKKFTDVCDVQYGFAFDSKFFTDDENSMPLIRIRDVMRGYSETFYNGEIPNGYLINEGDYLVGMDGEFNIGRWGKRPGLLNQRVCRMSSSSKLLDNQYMYYFMKVCLKSIEDETPFVTVKHLSAKRINQIEIPLPPFSTQQSIASELDKINELICLKREQLIDYDRLANSLFYEMFGDPIENEKGWEIKKIGEIGTVERGAGISKKDFVEEGLPCIHYGQLHTILGPTTRHHHSCIPESLLPKYKIAHMNDVIMAITSEDVEGSCKSTAWLGNYDIVIGSDAAILHHEQDGTFLSYYTMTKAFFNEKCKYAKGFKVTHISAKEIENIPVYLPPLALQKDFAKRIEVIELQKENIKSTIQDLETLLASRMQYWFD